MWATVSWKNKKLMSWIFLKHSKATWNIQENSKLANICTYNEKHGTFPSIGLIEEISGSYTANGKEHTVQVGQTARVPILAASVTNAVTLATYWTSLNFSFLTYKIGIIITVVVRIMWRFKEIMCGKYPCDPTSKRTCITWWVNGYGTSPKPATYRAANEPHTAPFLINPEFIINIISQLKLTSFLKMIDKPKMVSELKWQWKFPPMKYYWFKKQEGCE